MKKDRIFASPIEQVKKFAFNREVAEVFDDMVSRSVPLYHEIQRMTVEIAEHFAQRGSRIYDLGCSTGTTLFLLTKAIRLPGVQLIGIDKSDAMLRKAKERMSDSASRWNLTLKKADLDGALDISRASVVILNWTLQFVEPANRPGLLRGIFDGLADGGCLIIVEKILPDDLNLQELYTRFHHAFKRRNSYSDLEIAQKREALEKVLIPIRIEENIALVRQAGFPLIDVFFRWYNFAGLMAIKR